ncbi:sulfotransferase domain-containing protein [Actinoplanes derwentensis]|uniref:Sulfotransferase domain-containing protein n=1 Tax=Actinoplanes derwentensis TaxID=113562 RepID=A0A1H1UU40_9ACTN|nr:sulfotransferase domain-containing protein [Actinoplanes derwentensis]SDS76062.1 Sulfotransferase domain-containing protein [Actinoplanes derwentensis]
MLNRAIMFAKQHSPDSVRVVARRAQLEAHNFRLRVSVPVADRCEFTNVYHCAVRKTASQWVKSVFSDPVVYRHSGLATYDPRYYGWKDPRVVPPNRIGLSLYFSHKRFSKMPKPDSHRAFFIYRDPRDLVVSSYFSTRDSHTPMGDVLEVRAILREKSKKEGMLHLIDHLAKKGMFSAVRSWVDAPPSENVRLVRYEDLTGDDQLAEMDALMRHCGIAVPRPELAGLLDKYSFSRMNDRKKAGGVSHYRKGCPGDWRNHFDDDLTQAFANATGNLMDKLGYDRESRPISN